MEPNCVTINLCIGYNIGYTSIDTVTVYRSQLNHFSRFDRTPTCDGNTGPLFALCVTHERRAVKIVILQVNLSCVIYDCAVALNGYLIGRKLQLRGLHKNSKKYYLRKHKSRPTF